MAVIRSFRDLDAWCHSMDLAVAAYELAKHLPASERFELAAQVRRAAVSVPANIAEGQSTGKNGRYLFHVRIALGSLGELVTHFEVAKRLGFLLAEDTQPIEEQLVRVGQLLHGLARSIRLKRIKTAAAGLAFLAALPLGYLALTIFR